MKLKREAQLLNKSSDVAINIIAGAEPPFKKRIKTALLAALSFILISCATYSKDVETMHVPPDRYRSLNCEELGHEFGQLVQRRNSLADELDEEASSDDSLLALTFFTMGIVQPVANYGQELEYALVKGQFEAVIRVGIEKRCNMRPW